jgi:hypothetical protein
MSEMQTKPAEKNWWGPVWRGLVTDSQGKHLKIMGNSLWLFIYLVIHANRQSGRLYRKQATIAVDMGVKLRTIRLWLSLLRKGDYIIIRSTGRASEIEIQKWKPISSN